jgi:hypothetical protein
MKGGKAPPVATKASNGSMAGAKRIGTNPTRRTNGGGPNRGHVGPKNAPYIATK